MLLLSIFEKRQVRSCFMYLNKQQGGCNFFKFEGKYKGKLWATKVTG